MGSVKVYVSDAIEQKFRKASMQVFGYHKGSLSSAAEQAFDNWSRNVLAAEKIIDIPKDPVSVLSKIWLKTSKTSVELQHEASKIRAGSVLKKMHY